MSVAGEIDLYTAPRLHGELVTVLTGDEPVRLVVDMSGVEFCDSTGMNVLLARTDGPASMAEILNWPLLVQVSGRSCR